MGQVVEAVYENGVLKPLERLDLNEREHVRITVEPLSVPSDDQQDQIAIDPLDGIRVATGIPDLAEHFDDYRFGRRNP